MTPKNHIIIQTKQFDKIDITKIFKSISRACIKDKWTYGEVMAVFDTAVSFGITFNRIEPMQYYIKNKLKKEGLT